MENQIEHMSLQELELEYTKLGGSLIAFVPLDRQQKIVDKMLVVLDRIEELNAKKDTKKKA